MPHENQLGHVFERIAARKLEDGLRAAQDEYRGACRLLGEMTVTASHDALTAVVRANAMRLELGQDAVVLHAIGCVDAQRPERFEAVDSGHGATVFVRPQRVPPGEGDAGRAAGGAAAASAWREPRPGGKGLGTRPEY